MLPAHLAVEVHTHLDVLEPHIPQDVRRWIHVGPEPRGTRVVAWNSGSAAWRGLLRDRCWGQEGLRLGRKRDDVGFRRHYRGAPAARVAEDVGRPEVYLAGTRLTNQGGYVGHRTREGHVCRAGRCVSRRPGSS